MMYADPQWVLKSRLVVQSVSIQQSIYQLSHIGVSAGPVYKSSTCPETACLLGNSDGVVLP